MKTEEASPEQLPPLLRRPPWVNGRTSIELPTLDLPALVLPETIRWTLADKASAACGPLTGAWRLQRLDRPAAHWLAALRIAPAGQAKVMSGEALREGDVELPQHAFHAEVPDLVLLLPDPAALAVWNSYPSKLWCTGRGDAIRAILAKHGEAALPGLAAYAQRHAAEGLALAIDVDSARLVSTALHALRHLKKARPPAIAWMTAHAITTLTTALPLAFGRDRTQRDLAQHGVRWLLSQGFGAEAREAAARHGSEMARALQTLQQTDPLQVLPSRIPRLAGFFVAPSSSRPVLRHSGAGLPDSAMEHLGTMLAISRLDAPYPGLAIVKDACTPTSLAEFAWDLFEAWMSAGASVKEAWAFEALGQLGDDETAHRLAPFIREWPAKSAHQRAVAGLDLLAAIGSDIALMHLNAIACKLKFKGLQMRARDNMEAMAEARALTADELADRLVPDLELDMHAALRLDFGPRQFRVYLDAALKPCVQDAQGTRLKDLPRPGPQDDATLAHAAVERFRQLKKDARIIAGLQITRMEMAMVRRMRWSAGDFRLFILDHPLMRQLGTRLVWGMYERTEAPARYFRIEEDACLVVAQDSRTDLPANASVGIAHVLEMPQPMQAAFGQRLGDLGIVQPFRQLGRETFILADAEHADSEIRRFAGKTVATGSVMGLVDRGWRRGLVEDGGYVGWFSKQVGEGLEVQLVLAPGMVVGEPDFEPRQRLPSIVLRRAGTSGFHGRVKFGDLDRIIVSEVLRDVALLAETAVNP
ncbi:DUF4132 domain-containing protein [Variovorax sp. RA8]|uniref:DUF4132 domain-containing protein n=1 Tax=Variovorax sp. (strain JCM 16519 / RA8) TaxID=662548 RepID=UPI0013168E48|nr:DUF4132 domain-containing protein [Variovorax sp. RA8]VTU24733.1 hypothetical protein RA8CHR_02992 [Variovorax sp. RA8]